MEPYELSTDWTASKPKVNYWQMISYLLFIAFIFSSFCAVLADQKADKASKGEAAYKAESEILKGEIESINERLVQEYDITDMVIKSARP